MKWEWGLMGHTLPREHRDSSLTGHPLHQVTPSSRAESPWGPGATSGILQDGDVRLSKALSYALRHGALKLGLPMGAGK